MKRLPLAVLLALCLVGSSLILETLGELDVSDSLIIPGTFLAALIYPQGAKSGRVGAHFFGVLVLFLNVVLYWLVAYVLLSVFARARRRAQS